MTVRYLCMYFNRTTFEQTIPAFNYLLKRKRFTVCIR